MLIPNWKSRQLLKHLWMKSIVGKILLVEFKNIIYSSRLYKTKSIAGEELSHNTILLRYVKNKFFRGNFFGSIFPRTIFPWQFFPRNIFSQRHFFPVLLSREFFPPVSSNLTKENPLLLFSTLGGLAILLKRAQKYHQGSKKLNVIEAQNWSGTKKSFFICFILKTACCGLTIKWAYLNPGAYTKGSNDSKGLRKTQFFLFIPFSGLFCHL